MTILEFSDQLYTEVSEKFSSLPEKMTMETARMHSSYLLGIIGRLREFIIANDFNSPAEEINFFKFIKPRFFSQLIYTQKIFELESKKPVGLITDLNEYYHAELSSIRKYIDDNRELLTYYKSGSALMDEIYFTRRETDLWISVSYNDYENDAGFKTIYDHRLSKLIAFEKVSSFLVECVGHLQPASDQRKDKVVWTGSKAALVELLYAVQTAGSCNNGTIDVKQLATHFEDLFNVHLGNFYRTFQEIRIRKMSRTTFLDHLKESLIKRMDTADENPRF